ncbi:MAG: hypothetical protein GF418_01810 [Chitinivibrionales bacterium]|nr:hypothetical protein [Chitinivibrionales bacterium]MBD3394335.1 hypothetical protein [Chitinivibrionales bacterium]
MPNCYCGSGIAFSKCCELFLKGKKRPPTAESLMRARYCAFATGEVDFVSKTILPDKRGDFDEQATRNWSLNSEWHGFEVKNIEGGGEDDATGTVEFVATYSTDGETHNHHEIAQFKKRSGRWYFVDGTLVAQQPFVREAPKVGRNDPCPCGSGKKYKRCCAARQPA